MDTSLRLLRLQCRVETLKRTGFQNTSFRDTYESCEPSPMVDPYEQPPCLGSTSFSDALRKSDLIYQRITENSLAINHKLDEELVKNAMDTPFKEFFPEVKPEVKVEVKNVAKVVKQERSYS
ncbi:hypothetical protein CTI12_AA400650 [Artemisia annua]|uniref:Uncharacterized protein n=1 Tax=Artemisia annua TaxID=35608 RepID=A0A2U1MB41_ARTAN|nr:hypothetical protein CTI12_AA400650 [Artemisia annua]